MLGSIADVYSRVHEVDRSRQRALMPAGLMSLLLCGGKLATKLWSVLQAPLHFFLGLPGCRQRDADGINGEVAAVSHDFPMTSSKVHLPAITPLSCVAAQCAWT